jgi:hypothetical protein
LKGFVFIIDMRGRKYEFVKPILKILQNLEENFNYHIHHVFIIKPDTFWQKQKTSFASAKYNFEHSLISSDQLVKYIDASQLTHDLDGTLSYSNDSFVDFRIKLESFLSQSADLLALFAQLQSELSTFDQPDTKEACQDAMVTHTSTKQRTFSITIEQLLNDGKSLLKTLIGHDLMMVMSNNEIGGTRDSGYSCSESSEPKFFNDFF